MYFKKKPGREKVLKTIDFFKSEPDKQLEIKIDETKKEDQPTEITIF